MTDATDQPSGFYASEGNSGYLLPAQQGEFLGRILDPIRSAALTNAIAVFPYISPGGVVLQDDAPRVIQADDGDPVIHKADLVNHILDMARMFEAYLDPPEERSTQ